MKDTKREVPIIERKRRWLHDGKPDCSRKDKPVFTDPQIIPGPCGRGWGGCGEERWVSGGIVLRDKKTKQVVHEEK